MYITNNETSFQSKIKFIDLKTFNQMTKHINPKKHEVVYPWSAKDIKHGKKIFTKGIMDCIAGGIVDNGNITMFHLGNYNQTLAKKYHQEGFNITDVERRLKANVNFENDNIHGFIIGGFQLNDSNTPNLKRIKKIKHIFDKNKIPYTEITGRKDVHYFGKFSMFYENKTDTLYLTNNLTNSRGLNGKGLEVEIKDDKTIEFNTYKKSNDRYGVRYNSERKKGNLRDFLESQFKTVKLCKFDEFA